MIGKWSSSSSEQTTSVNSYYPAEPSSGKGCIEIGRQLNKALADGESGLFRKIKYLITTWSYRAGAFVWKNTPYPDKAVGLVFGLFLTISYVAIWTFSTPLLAPTVQFSFLSFDNILFAQTGFGTSSTDLFLYFALLLNALSSFILFTMIGYFLSPVFMNLLRRLTPAPYHPVIDRRISLLTTITPPGSTRHETFSQPRANLIGCSFGRNVNKTDISLHDKCMEPCCESGIYADKPAAVWPIDSDRDDRNTGELNYALIWVIENDKRHRMYNSRASLESGSEEDEDVELPSTLPREEVLTMLSQKGFPCVHYTTLNGMKFLGKDSDGLNNIENELTGINTGVVAFAEDSSQLDEIRDNINDINSPYDRIKGFNASTQLYYGPINNNNKEETDSNRPGLIERVFRPLGQVRSGLRSPEWMKNNIDRLMGGKPPKRSRLNTLWRRTTGTILCRPDQLHMFTMVPGQDAKTANLVGGKRADQTIIDDISPYQEERYTTDFGGEEDE